jgi:hypothetical protein
MPYCMVNNQPVFLYTSRYKAIQEKALKDKSAAQKVSGIIAGTKESKEVQEYIYNYLRKQYDEDPVNFHTNWVAFNITGKEAAQEVWDILSDYCKYYGYAYLSDLRDFMKEQTDDHNGDSYKYPMGQVFALNHFVQPARWWWRYTQKMNGRTLSLVIVAKTVQRLVGDLANFTIYTNEYRLNCGPNLGIYPLLKSKSSKK